MKVKSTGDVVEALRSAIGNLLVIKGRLPLLQAVARELERMEQGRDLRVRNDAVLRVVRDSYDMLVVDLASLREGVTGKCGLFNMLRHLADELRRFGPDDVNYGPVHYSYGQPLSASDEAAFVAGEKARMAEHRNRAFDRLFPAGIPVRGAHLDELMRRFRKDTKPTDGDRNRARAHRYEDASKDAAKYFQSLDQVEAQILVFEQYFNDLFYVLADGTFSMTPLVRANAESTARDLADLILLGSINMAVVQYGVVQRGGTGGEPPLYWYRRKQFYEQVGSVPDDLTAPAREMAAMSKG